MPDFPPLIYFFLSRLVHHAQLWPRPSSHCSVSISISWYATTLDNNNKKERSWICIKSESCDIQESTARFCGDEATVKSRQSRKSPVLARGFAAEPSSLPSSSKQRGFSEKSKIVLNRVIPRYRKFLSHDWWVFFFFCPGWYMYLNQAWLILISIQSHAIFFFAAEAHGSFCIMIFSLFFVVCTTARRPGSAMTPLRASGRVGSTPGQLLFRPLSGHARTPTSASQRPYHGQYISDMKRTYVS